MVKQYNKNIAKVAILFFSLLTMQYISGIAWTLNGKKNEIYSHQNYTNKFSPERRRRFKKKIPKTTTKRGKQKKFVIPVAVLLVDGGVDTTGLGVTT